MYVKKFIAKSWYCAGCIQINNMIGEDWTVQEVDIDGLSRDELKKLNLRGVPLLVAFNEQDEEVGRLQGVPTKQVLEDFLSKYS